MDDFIGSDLCPNLGYLASSMGMFDRIEHEVAAYQWLEYRLSPDALATILAAFAAKSLAHAAVIFEGNETQIIACEALEFQISLEILEEFWDRFLKIIIDRNTLILANV